ncbi:AAA family ATPase [Virgibacillus salexigens]|uniref:AAA family ATPase n=1 Tax=Virgibacillus salexigens TaxID=61016 RepID=UPI001909DB29|nr:AAA family ATPase [Virgibacillus salexigens]
MSLLPENKRKVAKETPRNFVIYGGTMHGKTYFADEFPNPINLNTDGNAEMIETPSININNQRNTKGDITRSASDLLSDVILELETTKHSYETVVIDVIDDIITMFEQEITEEHNVKSVGDISWGKGHQMLEMMVRVLVMRLKELSMKKQINILYLSRLTIIEDNDVEQYLPSLKLKWLNIVNGNSDYTILCRKIGKNYIRKVESKRKNYTKDKVDDERISGLLDTVIGAFDKSKKTSTADAKKIVNEQEKQQEAQRVIKQKEREAAVKEDKPEPKQETKTENKTAQKRPPRISPKV